MAEKFGPWREVSRCRNCGHVIAKESKWTVAFFVPVCPNCGKYNTESWPPLFDGVTARAVTTRFGRFLRWDFRGDS